MPHTVLPRLSLGVSPDADRDQLAFARALGCECVYTWVRPEQRTAAYLGELRRIVEGYGLALYMVGSFELGKSDRIHLALPGRDDDLRAYQQFLGALGAAGIGVTTFTWEPDRVWSSPPAASRGAEARHVDLAELRARPHTHGRAYNVDELWDNFAYAMRRLIPAAEDAGVRLALHPNDPPTAPLGGIPCLIRSAADYRRAFEIAASPALGMEFCCGCWLEGGDDFGDILAGIAEFGRVGRILIVHFRNVSATLPVFTETFLDNGYADMAAIMQALLDVGYAGTVTYDHTPRMPGIYEAGGGPAFGMGYIRALMNCLAR